MRINFRVDHRDVLHTTVNVFIDGALTGTLCLRGRELAILVQTLQVGCAYEAHELQITGLGLPAHGFTCPRCGSVSFNPTDLAERYCGRCHVFVDDGAPGLMG